jgi:preprotein translocase subunit SecB
MKKYNLTPQEYKKILEKIELTNITLVELKSKFSEDIIDKKLDVNIKETSKNQVEGEILKIYILFSFLVKKEETKNDIIKINIKYRADFNFEEEIKSSISDDFIKILTEHTVKITLWPYFRQELQNMLSKMNLPQLILPLRRK